MRFRFTESPIDTESGRRELQTLSAGGYVSFEGWLRDLNTLSGLLDGKESNLR